MKKTLLSTIITLVLTSIVFSQDLPTTINYQGILKDAAGVVVQNGNYNLTFKLYDAESGGTTIWNETKTINVVGGIINTQLGSVTPIPSTAFAGMTWLGITIESGSELTPRISLSSVPYSFMSMNVPNGSITATKIANDQVVKSLNGLKDNVNLVAGTNVTITPSGNNITINAAGGGGGTIGGSGTANYFPLFTGATTLGNSVIYQTGGNIGIGTTTPGAKFELSGNDALINSLTIGKGTGNISNNSAFGYRALYNNTSGDFNTAIGRGSLISNTSGSSNTALGYGSLNFNSEGRNNVAVGYQSLRQNKGNGNTAVGTYALEDNWANSYSTAIGYNAMAFAENSLTGRSTYNTALGSDALRGFSSDETTGIYNTAVGSYSMTQYTTGYSNTACGFHSLHSINTGYFNVAVGAYSLSLNGSGFENTGIGAYSCYNNEGNQNSAVGRYSLYLNEGGSGNSAIGYSAGDWVTTVNLGTFIGSYCYAGASSLTNITGIGYNTRPTTSNQVRIGNSSITSIGGYAGWTNLSDGRYKTSVQENVKGLDFVMKLRPVTYRLDVNRLAADLKEDQKRDENGNIITAPDQNDIKSRNEKSQIVYTGFVAQEVEKAANEVGFNFSGVDAPKNENDFYGLRYAEFVVPLVKAVQEQQKIIEELTKRIEELERR